MVCEFLEAKVGKIDPEADIDMKANYRVKVDSQGNYWDSVVLLC